MPEDIFLAMEISKEELVKIYSRLVYTAKAFLRFRKGSLKSIGKEAEDYASESLLSYFEDPTKYVPGKGRSLTGYLINHKLRHLVSDDFRDRKRDQQANLFFKFKDRDELDETLYLLDLFLDEEIDFEQIVKQVNTKLREKREEILVNVYEARYINVMKPADVRAQFGLTTKEYANAIAKIQRILDKVIQEYRLNRRHGK